MRENVEIRKFSVIDFTSKMMSAVAGNSDDTAFQKSIDEIHAGRANFRVEKVEDVEDTSLWIVNVAHKDRVEMWIIWD